MTKKYGILVFVVLAALGCGKPAQKKPSDETINKIKGDSSQAVAPSSGAAATALEGLWISDCLQTSELTDHYKQIYKGSDLQNPAYSGLVGYYFNKDAFVKTTIVYKDDENCEDASAISYVQITGKVSVQSLSTSNSYQMLFTPQPGKIVAWKNQGLLNSGSLWFGSEVSPSAALSSVNLDVGFNKY